MPPFSEETLKPSVNQTKDKVPTKKINSEHQKSVIPAEKKDIRIYVQEGLGNHRKKLKTFQYGED